MGRGSGTLKGLRPPSRHPPDRTAATRRHPSGLGLMPTPEPIDEGLGEPYFLVKNQTRVGCSGFLRPTAFVRFGMQPVSCALPLAGPSGGLLRRQALMTGAIHFALGFLFHLAVYAVQFAAASSSALVTVGALSVQVLRWQSSPAAHGIVCVCCCCFRGQRGYPAAMR